MRHSRSTSGGETVPGAQEAFLVGADLQPAAEDVFCDLGCAAVSLKKKKSYIKAFYDSKEKILDDLESQSEEKIRNTLIKFSGIGNWTCDMVLIF